MAQKSRQAAAVVLFGLVAASLAVLSSALRCPEVPVSVSSNGSLIFRPLSTPSGGSEPSYDPGAIGGWYSMAGGFIEAVRSGSLPYGTIKEGLDALNVPCTISNLRANCTSEQLTAATFNPIELVESFVGWLAGLIVVTLIGGILAISFLVCLCCFWCCRCCGNCGGGKTQKMSDHMECKTIAFTITLLLFTLVLFVGVILAFFSNEQSYRSLENFQDSLHTVTGTGASFVDHTITEVEELLCQLAAPNDSVATIVLDEARGFSSALQQELNSISDDVFGVLGTLQALPDGLVATTDALIRVSDTTLALVTSFVSLTTTLTTITSQLANLVSNCTTNAADTAVCSMIPSPDTIGTDANFSALPNVTGELESVRDALQGLNLSQSIMEGQEEFDKITRNITTSVDEVLRNVTDELESVVNLAFDIVNGVITSIRTFLDESQVREKCPALEDGSVFSDLDLDFAKILSNTSGQVPDVGYIQECIINQGFDYLRRFDVYRYAFGIVICSLSLVTILFVLVGIVFGMIGFKKDTDPSERTRLSHCGGIILLIGVTVTFVMGSLLLILTALMFFFGASAQKLCNSIEGPDYPLFAELIDDQEYWGGSLGGELVFQTIDPSITDAVLSVSVALRNCEKNEALFSAFNLSNLLPARSISAQIQTSANISQFEEAVDGLVNEAAGTFNFTNTSFLPDEAQTSLKMFADANVQNINITSFEEELNKSVLSFDINETVDALVSFNNSLNGGATGQQSGGMSNAVDELVMNLRSLETQIANIGNQVNTLQEDVRVLELAINTTVLTTTQVVDAIEELVTNITGVVLVRVLDNTVGNTIKRTVGYISDYIYHLESVVMMNVSRCQPLSNIYTSTYNSICGVFLDGLNGFWWSLGFCSILFIPVIIFSIITSTCYLRKHTDKNGAVHPIYPMEPLPSDEAKEKHEVEVKNIDQF